MLSPGENQHNPKPDVAGPEVMDVPIAIRTTTIPRMDEPRTATHHPQIKKIIITVSMLEMFYSMHNLQHEVHMDASPALRFVLL